MSIVTTFPDGQAIDPEALAQTLVYNGDGTLNYVQVTAGDDVFRQTMTYTAGAMTGISQWVKQ